MIARITVIVATLIVLVGLWRDQLPPVHHVQVDYCWIDMYHYEEIKGKQVKVWTEGYGLCSEQDIYRDI